MDYPYNQLPLAWIQVICPHCGMTHPKIHELETFEGNGGIKPQTLLCQCGNEIRMGKDPVPVHVFVPPAYNDIPA